MITIINTYLYNSICASLYIIVYAYVAEGYICPSNKNLEFSLMNRDGR